MVGGGRHGPVSCKRILLVVLPVMNRFYLSANYEARTAVAARG